MPGGGITDSQCHILNVPCTNMKFKMVAHHRQTVELYSCVLYRLNCMSVLCFCTITKFKTVSYSAQTTKQLPPLRVGDARSVDFHLIFP